MESGLLDGPAGWAVSAVYVGYCVSVTRLLIARIPTEDEAIREELGDEWEEWWMRTPWRLVLYVY